MARRTYRYAVTFEYDQAAPDTIRGSVVAGRAQTAAFRALAEASRVRRQSGPRSIVILLEVAGPAADEVADEPATLPPLEIVEDRTPEQLAADGDDPPVPTSSASSR